MKRALINSSILFFGIMVLNASVFIGDTYLIAPNQLLIPNPLPASVIVDLLVLCVFPGLLFAATYLWSTIKLSKKDPSMGGGALALRSNFFTSCRFFCSLQPPSLYITVCGTPYTFQHPDFLGLWLSSAQLWFFPTSQEFG